MEGKGFYRVLVVGPTGAGKSQFCNFVQKDLTNGINKVSNSLNSCTKDPQSNCFTRNNINYEFIDTAGSADSSKDDIKNLELLIDFIKKKETIDYISLLLKFGERMDCAIREYLNKLGKIFTASEFYSHLCVFFTKYPIKPKKKDKELREQSIKQINEILKEIFEIKKDAPIPDVKVYFIDTDLDEDEDDKPYDEKSQDTIDIMMEQMKMNVNFFGAINTKNFDYTGKGCEIRKEYEKNEFNKLIKKLEEEKLNKEKEEEEKKRLKEEIKKLEANDKKRKKKEEDLKILLEKQKEELQKKETILKENEKIIQIQKKIEEEARKKGIEISRLDNNIDYYLDKAHSLFLGGGSLFTISGCVGIFGNVYANSFLYYPLVLGVFGGYASYLLAGIPLIIAGGYKLKKMIS